MAGVFIDIPGVGNVEAKNAASESTLRELLKAMQGVEKKITGKNAKGGAGGDTPVDDPVKGPGGALGAAFGKLSKTVMPVIGGFKAFGNALSGITDVIGSFANVGDSVERAAQQIPIFGGMLGTVAAAAVKTNEALLAASKSGAAFGGSITQFAGAASSAGMTMDKFGALVARNGEGMLGFGATTEEGSKRFSQVSKALRTTSSDLYALGFSTEDINQGLASYGSLMRTQGLQGKQSNEQMVNGAKTYLRELDAMAKVTGEERSAKEAQMKALAQDAQFQASMAGQSAEARQSFLTTVGKIPGPLQGFVKDFLATGTLTTEETQRIGAMMGGDVMNELQGLRNKLQSGAVLSAQEQDRLGIIMKRAAEQQLKNAGTSLAGATDMHGSVVAVASALTIQEGAVKKSAEEQRAAALESSGFNKKMQESQQRLAEFSNGFQIALANSGMIDFLMNAFSVMANLVQTFVVPAFNILATVITSIGGFLFRTLGPVFTVLGEAITTIGDYLVDALGPTFEYIGEVIGTFSAFVEDNIIPIMLGLGTALIAANLATIANVAATIAKTIALIALIGPIGLVALGMAALASPLLPIALGIAALIGLFKVLYDNGWSFGTAIDAVKDNLKRFGLGFKDIINDILAWLGPTFGGISKEEADKRKEASDAAKKELDDRRTERDSKRKLVADERQAQKDSNAKARENNKIGKKELADKKAIADEKSKLDYNASTEGLLKQYAIKEGSPLVPKDKQEAAKKAEGTKKEIEAKGEAKTAADEKAKADAVAKEEADKKSKEGGDKPKTPAGQESAETLLAQLNTSMARLIQLTAQTTTNTYEQVKATKSLSGDLFNNV